MLPQGIVPALNMVCFSGFFSHRAMLLFWNNGLIGFPIYSSNTNISFFHSADEFEIVRQQRTQFALIFARISEEFLTSGFEFGERLVVSVIQPKSCK